MSETPHLDTFMKRFDDEVAHICRLAPKELTALMEELAPGSWHDRGAALLEVSRKGNVRAVAALQGFSEYLPSEGPRVVEALHACLKAYPEAYEEMVLRELEKQAELVLDEYVASGQMTKVVDLRTREATYHPKPSPVPTLPTGGDAA